MPYPLLGAWLDTSLPFAQTLGIVGYDRLQPMKQVNHQRVSLALERVDGTTFENFFHAFYSALTGIQFIPLGGTHDGGADAFHGDRIFKGRSRVFYQATTEEGHAGKIKRTVNRLREYGRDPSTLHFVTSRVVTSIDKEEEALSEDLDLNVKIRDRKWITSNINDSPQTVAAFQSFLEPTLSFLRELGGATTIQQNVPARTLCVFLGQEIDRRRGDTEVLEAVTDSLILWSLEGTDPDRDIFMTRSEILDKIESALPSAKHFVRNAFDDRIATMASKGNPTGREIRWYRQEDKFCLPFDTRTTVTQENTRDEALRLTVTELYERRARDLLKNDETLFPSQIADLAHTTLEKTFERQGLDLAEFLTDNHDDAQSLTIADQLDSAIEDASISPKKTARAKEVTLKVLQQAFYNSTESERLYYGKLSRTYTLLLTLRNEPKIVEYFKDMSSRFVLFVGTDIIVQALSERYLSPENQKTINMLRILRDAGSTLIVTHATVEEVREHIKGTDYEFRTCFDGMEHEVSQEIARHASKILIRAYFHARIDPFSESSPLNWRVFVDQICDYHDLVHNFVSRSREQVKNYLTDKFSLEYLDETDVADLVDEEEATALAEQIKSIRTPDVLAFNDARQVLAVYGKRKALNEGRRPSPYGYRTWWLTHETKIRQCTRKVVRSRGSEYIIRPEFILNFVSLSPSTKDVRRSYDTIFPTLLGVRLSNRMRENVFHDVMKRAKKIRGVDESRARAMMEDLSNRLKGDNYKQYESELISGPLALRHDAAL